MAKQTIADQIRDLNSKGQTLEEIVEKLNVTKARIKKILNRRSRTAMKAENEAKRKKAEEAAKAEKEKAKKTKSQK